MIPAKFFAVILGTSLCISCAPAAPSTFDERMESSGWVEEPLLEGAESRTGMVSPRQCQPLFKSMNDSSKGAVRRGFRHRTDRSYLLVMDRTGDHSDVLGTVKRAPEECPTMYLGYDSARLEYAISSRGEDEETASIGLVGTDDSGALVVEMLLGVSTTADRTRVVRLMNDTTGAHQQLFTEFLLEANS